MLINTFMYQVATLSLLNNQTRAAYEAFASEREHSKQSSDLTKEMSAMCAGHPTAVKVRQQRGEHVFKTKSALALSGLQFIV